MAMRAVFHRSKVGDIACLFSQTRSSHAIALPAPSCHAIDSPTMPPLCLPEDGFILGNRNGFQFPDFASGGGSMELMAVPKKKVSSHKRGIRNGPRALKPIPVIIRCKQGLANNSTEKPSKFSRNLGDENHHVLTLSTWSFLHSPHHASFSSESTINNELWSGKITTFLLLRWS